jgi:hypothetical protein
MSTSQREEKFDPSRRRLCPDGACIGLLDERGRCKVCGRAGAAGAATAIAPDAAVGGFDDEARDLDDDLTDGADDADGEEPLEALPSDGEATGFDAGRRLCPDGACLGVVGADGRCSVCGLTPDGDG